MRMGFASDMDPYKRKHCLMDKSALALNSLDLTSLINKNGIETSVGLFFQLPVIVVHNWQVRSSFPWRSGCRLATLWTFPGMTLKSVKK